MDNELRLTIYRGLPGSGKSTLARTESMTDVVEADDFFMFNGEYKYDTSKSADAHMYCRGVICFYLFHGENIAVANTFITQEQVDPYIEIAKRYNAKIKLVSCKNNYGNVHDVPEDVLEKMRASWEDDIVIPDDVRYIP